MKSFDSFAKMMPVSRVAVFLLALMLLSVTAGAQISDKFTNLKVLPKDISKDDLLAKMRGFSQALGVRCDHCHAEATEPGARGLDFASDAKHAKIAARIMMRMTSEINQDYIANAADSGMKPENVACITCHHREPKPTSLERELREALDKGGVDSAMARYDELRKSYYGSAAYDFGTATLVELVSDLSKANRTDEALAFAKLNAQEYPDSAVVWEMFVPLYANAGENDKAIEACQKALKLDPENRRLQHALQQLQSGQ